MHNNKGTTLVELLVGIIIASLIVLTVGAIAELGKTTRSQLRAESMIYNDIAYGFKLMQSRMHKVNSEPERESASTPWTGGERIEIGNEIFGIYDDAGGMQSFVYVPDKTDLSTRQVIFQLPDNSFTMDVEPNDPVNQVEITLSGVSNGQPFNMKTTITGRKL